MLVRVIGRVGQARFTFEGFAGDTAAQFLWLPASTTMIDWQGGKNNTVGISSGAGASASYITDIGKGLMKWDALDTGVFLITERFFQTTRQLIKNRGICIEKADVIRFMIEKSNNFNTCNVSGCFWIDIDTEEDLAWVKV